MRVDLQTKIAAYNILRSKLIKRASPLANVLSNNPHFTTPWGAAVDGALAPSKYNLNATTAELLKGNKWLNKERLLRDSSAAEYIGRRGGLYKAVTRFRPSLQRRLIKLMGNRLR